MAQGKQCPNTTPKAIELSWLGYVMAESTVGCSLSGPGDQASPYPFGKV